MAGLDSGQVAPSVGPHTGFLARWVTIADTKTIYSCGVYGDFELTLNLITGWVYSPKSQTSYIGKSATFTCKSQGAKKATKLEWYLGSSTVEASDRIKFVSVAGSPFLPAEITVFLCFVPLLIKAAPSPFSSPLPNLIAPSPIEKKQQIQLMLSTLDRFEIVLGPPTHSCKKRF